MPKFREYNQNQSMLLPLRVSDCLPIDHICYVINDVVNNLDLQVIESTYSDNGSPAYDPRLMIKVMFYAYTQGIRSSRKIETQLYENNAFRFLSANQQPDHGTINLFRQLHLVALEELFAQIVIMSDGLGMINLTDISLDGSKIKANASKKNLYTQEKINKLRKKIRQILNEAEKIDEEEDKQFGDSRGYNAMPEKIINPETRQKEIAKLKKN